MEVNVGNLQHTVDNTGHKIISLCNSLQVLSDRPNDLIEVAARRSRITQREADNLFGINHKHRPDLQLVSTSNRCTSTRRNHSKRQALLVDVARILVVEHVIERRNLPIGIGDLWRA